MKEDMDYETQVLINEAKLGDKEALNRLFARYQNRVMRIVRLRLHPDLREKLKMQSMDIVQEVFIAALRKLNEFEPTSKGAFLHWLSKIVENFIRDQIDYFSAQKRHSPLKELPLDETLRTDSGSEVKVSEIIPSEDTSPSQYASKKEIKGALDNLLLRLEDADREVIILYKLEELTFKEVAQLYNKTEDAVRKQYHRALQKLISLVEEDPIFKGI
jgi:RNA polymerase sigma-70 factor (ECF subfamily)